MAHRILKTNELQIIRSNGTADAMRLTGLTRSQVKSARNRYPAPGQQEQAKAGANSGQEQDFKNERTRTSNY